MSQDPDAIQKLLRLKRYEQPPEGYLEGFLTDFHRRQRQDLLRRTPWQAFVERVTGWFEEARVPSVAYAGIAAAGIAVAALMVRPSAEVPQGAALALAAVTTAGDADPGASAISAVADPASVQRPLPPSYVLETRPVSYEAPFSF